MHIVVAVIFGLVSLAAFVAAATLLNRVGWALDAGRIFVWVWLAASIVNGGVGVFVANVPLLNEIGAFIPIFGFPAGLAGFLSRRHRLAGAAPDVNP